MYADERGDWHGFPRAFIPAINTVKMFPPRHENGCCVSFMIMRRWKLSVRFAGFRVACNDDGPGDVGLWRIVLVIDELRQYFQVYVLSDETCS